MNSSSLRRSLRKTNSKKTSDQRQSQTMATSTSTAKAKEKEKGTSVSSKSKIQSPSLRSKTRSTSKLVSPSSSSLQTGSSSGSKKKKKKGQIRHNLQPHDGNKSSSNGSTIETKSSIGDGDINGDVRLNDKSPQQSKSDLPTYKQRPGEAGKNHPFSHIHSFFNFHRKELEEETRSQSESKQQESLTNANTKENAKSKSMSALSPQSVKSIKSASSRTNMSANSRKPPKTPQKKNLSTHQTRKNIPTTIKTRRASGKKNTENKKPAQDTRNNDKIKRFFDKQNDDTPQRKIPITDSYSIGSTSTSLFSAHTSAFNLNFSSNQSNSTSASHASRNTSSSTKLSSPNKGSTNSIQQQTKPKAKKSKSISSPISPNSTNNQRPPTHSKTNTNSQRSLSGKSVGSQITANTDLIASLPRHLIRKGLIAQAVFTIKDERFLNKRMEMLGPIDAAKALVSDCECLQRRDDTKSTTSSVAHLDEHGEKNQSPHWDEESHGHRSTLSTFPTGEDSVSVTLDAFGIFEHLVMEQLGLKVVQMVNFIEIPNITFDNGDSFDAYGDGQWSINSKTHSADNKRRNNNNNDADNRKVRRNMSLKTVEVGEALYILGKSLHAREWIEDAMPFFKHALYLFLLEYGVKKQSLLDASEDCAGFFYIKIASNASKRTQVSDSVGNILTKMGDIHGTRGEVNDALHAYKSAQAFFEKHLSDNKFQNAKKRRSGIEGMALVHNRVGGVYCSRGDLPVAMESFEKALDLLKKSGGNNDLEFAKTLHNIGVIHRHSDDLDKAYRSYSEAHRIFEKKLGKNNLDTVRTLNNLGGVHRRRKEYDEAMQCFREVLRVREKLLGKHHPSVSLTIVNIAAVLRRSGRENEAKKYYLKAMT